MPVMRAVLVAMLVLGMSRGRSISILDGAHQRRAAARIANPGEKGQGSLASLAPSTARKPGALVTGDLPGSQTGPVLPSPAKQRASFSVPAVCFWRGVPVKRTVPGIQLSR